MKYFILDEKNQQAGPFSIEQLKAKNIKKTTKIWRHGMKDWTNAEKLDELISLFAIPQSPNFQAHSPQITTSHNVVSNTNYSQSFVSRHPQTLTSGAVYDENFNVNSLNSQEIDSYKKNSFFDTLNTGVAILLHFLTLGIFTTIYCGLKHSKLPKITSDDFSGGKAIGFLFIPFYNFYWIFVFWRHLAKRINFQFKLRNENPPVSLGLATTVSSFYLIPYIGFIINYLILMPILFAQIQSASNKLANENINNNQYGI